MSLTQKAERFANSIAVMVRYALDGMNPVDRLVYLDALNGLNNEWHGDDMQAREELGMLEEVSAEGPPF